jgi:hypothetical protein
MDPRFLHLGTRWRGSGYMDPRFLHFGTRWRLVTSFTPRTLYPRGKSPPPYPWARWLSRPPSQSGRQGKVKILPPPGLKLRPLGRPAGIQSLYRLRYPGSNLTLYNTKCFSKQVQHLLLLFLLNYLPSGHLWFKYYLVRYFDSGLPVPISWIRLCWTQNLQVYFTITFYWEMFFFPLSLFLWRFFARTVHDISRKTWPWLLHF